MAELLKVSVKQLEMAHGCPRKWAYHYLDRLPQIESEALTTGNALHSQMKALLQQAVPPYGPETFIGKMARELLPYAQNKSGRHVSEIEKLVNLPEYGLQVDLRCDYLDKPVLKDWKTTGAPQPQAKLPGGKYWALQSLENSWQANIYAFLLMREHWAGLREVYADWCYVSKKFGPGQTPRTWVVSHTFTWDATLAWFERMVLPTAALIREMRELRASGHLDTCRLVPHNPKACEFSGKFCDVAGHCAFISSPVATYDQLHLPILQEKAA